MVSQYSLYNLYSKGIIDYIPDLGGGINYNQTNGNQYFINASSGADFQNYANRYDTFTSTGVNNYQQSVGTNSTAGMNAMGMSGIGTHSTAALNAMGAAGIGSDSSASLNALGTEGIGTHASSGTVKALGGFTDIERSITGSFAAFSDAPSPIKGIFAALIGGVGIYMLFKGKKKPPKHQAGFLTKINPFKSKAQKKVK